MAMFDRLNVLPKFMSLGSEARVRSTTEMWRRRDGKPIGKRVGATMIGFAMHSSALQSGVNALLARQMPPDLGQLIGNGYHQLVFAQEALVTKVLVRTISKDSSRVADTAEELQTESDLCRRHLGSSWLSTAFETLRLKNDKSVVVARQSYLRHDQGAFLFPTANDVPDDAFRREHAERLAALSDATALYPDLIGPRNLARTTKQPIIHVDTMPLRADAPDAQASISEIERTIDSWRVH